MKSIKPKAGKILPNADVLIYNSFGTGTNRRFIRYDLKDVFWDEVKEANAIRMGTSTANSVSMFVDERINYISPDEWNLSAKTRKDIEGKFTIQKGDMIILATPHTLAHALGEFNSTVQIANHFGIDYAHQIMSVDKKILPNRTVSHFEVSGQ